VGIPHAERGVPAVSQSSAAIAQGPTVVRGKVVLEHHRRRAGREFQAVGFIDADRGWVASFHTLYSTTDGGATWKMLAFRRLVNRMRVVNDSLVYACGDRVYRWRR